MVCKTTFKTFNLKGFPWPLHFLIMLSIAVSSTCQEPPGGVYPMLINLILLGFLNKCRLLHNLQYINVSELNVYIRVNTIGIIIAISAQNVYEK